MYDTNTVNGSLNFLNDYLRTQVTPDTIEPVYDQNSIVNLPTDQGDIAMSRGQARQLIDRLTQEALRKNITPDAFVHGMFELSELGKSPDYSRRLIRNTLKSPGGRFAINNPGAASQLMGKFTQGVNPALAGKHMGLIKDVLQEARKDDLLRSDVTLEETRREIQQPIYGALMDWTKANMNNPEVQNILLRTPMGVNAETFGKRGLIPISAGFDPTVFGR
jgi:hypothetical protein